MVAEKELKTFSAFEGKVMGNTIKGISLIQEGPALGHGVWVDSVMLSQVKKLGAAAGRVKAKLNHWSGIQDTVGFYENFRIRGGKCLADLTLFDSHEGKDALLEMIETIPGAFGVSIMFRPDEAEYDKTNDRYNARVRELYSADFVDTPAANRDGVFEEGIDKGENDMPAITVEAFDAYKAEQEAAKAALQAKLDELTAALAAKADKPADPPAAPEPPKPDAAFAAITEKLTSLETALKAFAAAPPTQTHPAPPSEAGNNDQPKPVTYAEAKTEYIGKATGLDRTRLSMAFDANPQLRPAHLR